MVAPQGYILLVHNTDKAKNSDVGISVLNCLSRTPSKELETTTSTN